MQEPAIRDQVLIKSAIRQLSDQFSDPAFRAFVGPLANGQDGIVVGGERKQVFMLRDGDAGECIEEIKNAGLRVHHDWSDYLEARP